MKLSFTSHADHMKLHRIKAVILRHLYEVRHNANHVTYMIYLPIVNIAVWGFFTVYLHHSEGLESSILNSLLGAVILWGMFNGFQRDMAVGFLEELWSRNLINLFASPLTTSEYVVALIVVNFGKAMVALAVESLIAWLFYQYNIFPMLLELMPFIFNLVFFALTVGILVTGLIFRYTTRLQALTWSFAVLLMPVSCVFYPLSALPHQLQTLAWLLPTTQSFEGMREAITSGTFSPWRFNCGLATNAVYFTLAIIAFRTMFTTARSRGLLVKIE